MIGEIINHVPRLLSEKGITDVTDFQYDIRVAKGTAESWFNGKPQRFDAEILAKLCAYFECGVGDLLEYVPSH